MAMRGVDARRYASSPLSSLNVDKHQTMYALRNPNTSLKDFQKAAENYRNISDKIYRNRMQSVGRTYGPNAQRAKPFVPSTFVPNPQRSAGLNLHNQRVHDRGQKFAKAKHDTNQIRANNLRRQKMREYELRYRSEMDERNKMLAGLVRRREEDTRRRAQEKMAREQAQRRQMAAAAEANRRHAAKLRQQRVARAVGGGPRSQVNSQNYYRGPARKAGGGMGGANFFQQAMMRDFRPPQPQPYVTQRSAAGTPRASRPGRAVDFNAPNPTLSRIQGRQPPIFNIPRRRGFRGMY